jgi:hypothetical protein
MEIPKVLVADPISERGVNELAEGGALDVNVKTAKLFDFLKKQFRVSQIVNANKTRLRPRH